MPKSKLILLTALALAAVAARPAQAQQVIHYSDAQVYRAEPLYPYVVQPAGRAYPYVSTQPAPVARPVAKVDPALVDELRKARKRKASPKAQEVEAKAPLANKKITKTVVIREKPVVRKTYRVVDDPPIIVQREVSEDQIALPQGHAQGLPATGRTIRAEAEVTIIGPDRMSIRLFRKRDGSDANASDKPAPKRDAKADTKTKIR
jgi:hypothetical protein